MEVINEKLKDALSIVSLLENEMELQKMDEIYIRATKVIHRLMSEACEEFNSIGM